MMELLGKFYSYFGSPNEGFLYFRASGHIPIYKYFNKTLKISVNNTKITGSIIRYVVEPKSMTIIFSIILNHDIVKNITELINQEVMMGFKSIPDEEIPLKRVSLQFYKKIKRTLAVIGKELGETPRAVERAILMEWGHPELNITSLSYHLDAMAFYEFMLEYIERYHLGIDINVEDNSIASYIQMCRHKKICAVCKDTADKDSTIYPLCKRHNMEFLADKGKFEDKYKLKYK
jgi:hypothetical protein